MPRVHLHRIDEPQRCSYLPGKTAQLEQRYMTEVTVEDLDALLERGWRRFGPLYFRPACTPCGECVSLRVPVSTFTGTDSQRRALRRSRRFRRTFGKPIVDDERLALYRAWHAAREDVRGWEPSELDAEGYAMQFAFPHPAIHELALYDGDRLVLVGLWDVAPRGMSAIYCFFDPEYARLSLGVANVMNGLELAREREIPFVYLGFRVLGCESLRYKDAFRPHELLEGRPSFREAPRWVPAPPLQPSPEASSSR